MKLNKIIKEYKISILIVVVVASITYALLSLIFSNWKWYGQLLSPILGIIFYTTSKLFDRDKKNG